MSGEDKHGEAEDLALFVKRNSLTSAAVVSIPRKIQCDVKTRLIFSQFLLDFRVMLFVNVFSSFGHRVLMALGFVLKHAIPTPVTISNIFWNLEVMAYLITVQTADLV